MSSSTRFCNHMHGKILHLQHCCIYEAAYIRSYACTYCRLRSYCTIQKFENHNFTVKSPREHLKTYINSLKKSTQDLYVP